MRASQGTTPRSCVCLSASGGFDNTVSNMATLPRRRYYVDGPALRRKTAGTHRRAHRGRRTVGNRWLSRIFCGLSQRRSCVIVPAPQQRASNSPGSTGRERPRVRSGSSVPTGVLPFPRTERGQRSAMLTSLCLEIPDARLRAWSPHPVHVPPNHRIVSAAPRACWIGTLGINVKLSTFQIPFQRRPRHLRGFRSLHPNLPERRLWWSRICQ